LQRQRPCACSIRCANGSAFAITASAPSRYTWIGLDASSVFTASGTRRPWARPRSSASHQPGEVHDVSASTQNQAQSALLFLYKDGLRDELPWLNGVERAKKPIRLPVVLTRQEVCAVLRGLHGTHALV